MLFLASMLLTSFIGFLVCYRGRENLGLIEKIFISIFIGWGYFTSLVLFYSSNFPNTELNKDVLFFLITISLMAFIIPAVIIKRRSIICSLRTITIYLKRINLDCIQLDFHNVKGKYYLIIPMMFLALILLSITIHTFWDKISWVDPIFQWEQRGELIFLEKNVSAALKHPFGYYPLHIPILYAWACFFNFNTIKIFYLIAFIGLLGIIGENVYSYSKSRYASIIFTIIVISVQAYYTISNYAEGIANIYFFFGVLYTLKYVEYKNTTFILLGSFFMTMHANTRSEGILYWVLLLLFFILISAFTKTFKIKYIIYYILPFLVFYYIPKLNFSESQGGLNIIMHVKIIIKCLFDIFISWGEIYKNELLMKNYHANSITGMILSLFAFWDSLFFDAQKAHFYNVVKTFIELIKHIRIELWILLSFILWKEVKSSDTIKRITIFVIYPFFCFMLLINYLQVLYYYDPNTLENLIFRAVIRYSGYILICIVFFLATNRFIKEIFNKIEDKQVLAWLLSFPLLYILFRQIWGIVLVY